MMRLLISALLAPVIAITLFMAPEVVAYNPFASTCEKAPNSPTCQQIKANGSQNPITDVIATAANIIAVLTGIIAVIMIIVGGFTFITSGGNAESVASARRTITYALVGAVVVALSWTIIRFITDKLL
jgi:hypothetical protein